MVAILDHYPFRLEADGACIGGFVEVTGIAMGTGAARGQQEVVCRRGILIGTDIWDWRAAEMDGVVERRTLSLSLRAEDGGETARWTLADAMVIKLSQPQLDPASGFATVENATFLCASVCAA